jgi:hypothetical protein
VTENDAVPAAARWLLARLKQMLGNELFAEHQAQVAGYVRSQVLAGNDVVDLQRSVIGRVRPLAVFTAAMCPLPNKLRERGIHHGFFCARIDHAASVPQFGRNRRAAAVVDRNPFAVKLSGPPYSIGSIHTPGPPIGAKLKILFSGMSDPYHEAEPGP